MKKIDSDKYLIKKVTSFFRKMPWPNIQIQQHIYR